MAGSLAHRARPTARRPDSQTASRDCLDSRCHCQRSLYLVRVRSLGRDRRLTAFWAQRFCSRNCGVCLFDTAQLPATSRSPGLPRDELLEPVRKSEKNNSEHEPTEHIEGPSEREYVENVRQRRTNERGDVKVSATVHTGVSDGRVLTLYSRVTRSSPILSISRVLRCSPSNFTYRCFTAASTELREFNRAEDL